MYYAYIEKNEYKIDGINKKYIDIKNKIYKIQMYKIHMYTDIK